MNNTKKRIAATLSAALITSAVLPVVASATQYTDYTVQKGDNLYQLAIQFNTTVDEIVATNNIANRHFISVNQYLSIPTNTKDATSDNSSSSSGSSNSSASSTSSSSTKYYYVLKNDTLSEIAAKFGTTVSQLAAWNNISNIDFIREGALLKVGNTYTSGSTGSSTGSSSSTGSASGSTSSGAYYTVVKNDTLSEIAQKFGTTVNQLAAWNNISNIHFIREGAVLQVKSVSSGSSSGSSSGTVASYQHKVVAGDNLYRLAITYGTTVSQLAEWNNIKNVRLIYVGDVLQVSADTNARSIESYYETPEIVEDVTPSTAEETVTTTPSATEMNVETATSTPVLAETLVNTADSTPVEDETSVETADSAPVVADTLVETDDSAVAQEETTVEEEIAVETADSTPVQEEIAVETADSAPVQEEITVETADSAPEAPSSELEVIHTADVSVEEETKAEARAISTVKTYKVTEDTTIFHLAALFNTPAASLISWNDLEDNQLASGTEVIVAV